MKWLWHGESNSPRWKGLGVLALAAALAVSVAMGARENSRNRATQRALEAAGAESIPGLVAANDEKLRVVAELQAKIDELKAIAPTVRVVETVRSVSEPINVELRALVIRQKAELARIDREAADRVAAAVERVTLERPECDGLIHPTDCPPRETPNLTFHFTVASDEVRLVSDAGSTFAVGRNSIYEGDCADMDSGTCTLAGAATWRSDVTTLVAPVVPARQRRLGWYAGGSYDLWQRSGDNYSASVAPWRVSGGPELAFRRMAIRLGATAGPDGAGVDVGFSFHGDQ